MLNLNGYFKDIHDHIEKRSNYKLASHTNALSNNTAKPAMRKCVELNEKRLFVELNQFTALVVK